MSSLLNQRMTSRHDDGFVVFLIGMRVNAWWKPWRWIPVASAMPRMIRELTAKPELGFLGAESWFGRTSLMLSYWKSKEHLLAFASRRDATHLPAWRAFNETVGTKGDVGIWHETYVVAARSYENVYVNMPVFGLGAAFGLVPAKGHLARASGRIGAATSA
ncbi:DUF4188 domain-containing protein [soil metagenome]